MEVQERKKSMKRCKITAVRKTEYKDLMEKYENPIQHACNVIKLRKTEIKDKF